MTSYVNKNENTHLTLTGLIHLKKEKNKTP